MRKLILTLVFSACIAYVSTQSYVRKRKALLAEEQAERELPPLLTERSDSAQTRRGKANQRKVYHQFSLSAGFAKMSSSSEKTVRRLTQKVEMDAEKP